jgi:hypothetical protein
MSGQEIFILKLFVALLNASQANVRIVPSVGLQSFHSSFFRTIQSFDAVGPKLLELLLAEMQSKDGCSRIAFL